MGGDPLVIAVLKFVSLLQMAVELVNPGLRANDNVRVLRRSRLAMEESKSKTFTIYSPVVKSSIRLFLTLAVTKGWHTRQVAFILAYPQADIL